MFVLLLIHEIGLYSQVRNATDNLLVPLNQKGDILFKDGTFRFYKAKYGLILHYKSAKFALPFIVISQDTTKPWLLVLNGGPGKSNLRLSFDIDSILNDFQVLIPGYRGVDDNFLNSALQFNDVDCKRFVVEHKSDFGTATIAQDIGLILNKLKIDSVYIVAHSYGGMVASELYKSNKTKIVSAYLFSPVLISNPIIDNNKIYSLLKYVSNTLKVDEKLVCHKLYQVYDSINKSNLFALGVVSQLYKMQDAKQMIVDLLNNKLNTSEVIKRGEVVFNEKTLLDFALKFGCNAHIIHIQADSYKVNFSKIFKDYIYKYSTSIDTLSVEYPEDSIFQYFIPRFDIYKTFDIKGKNSKVYDNYAHSDIWINGSKILRQQLDFPFNKY